MKKRYGRFSIPIKVLNNPATKKAIQKLMGRMIIYRAECRHLTGEIDYEAESDYFEEVFEGNKMPNYEFEFSGSSIKANKLER